MCSVEQIQEAILRDGVAFINVWSQDCDGVQGQYHKEFDNVEQFLEWEESFWEWAEGSQGFSLTDKNNLDEHKTWGGWGDY
jgi:hypothetical protein